MNGKHTGYCVLPIIFFLLCVLLICAAPPRSTASNGNYYYLQIGTFSVEGNAKKLVHQVYAHTPRVVLRGAESASLGWVYTVYVGPFTTWAEADAVRIPIRKQGILIEDAFVVASSEPFAGSLPVEAKKPEPPEAETPPPPPAPESAVSPMVEPTPTDDAPDPEPGREESSVTPPAPVAETEPTPETDPQEIQTTPERRHDRTGRNLGKGVFSLAYSHTYGEYQTEIDSRQSRTNGTITDIPVGTLQGSDFDTTMHRDLLRVRYGVLDRFDLFAEGGMAYDESATPRPVFGGGGRFEFFNEFVNRPGGIFLAVQGDFLVGSLETEFTAAQGGKWQKNQTGTRPTGDWRWGFVSLDGSLTWAVLIPYTVRKPSANRLQAHSPLSTS